MAEILLGLEEPGEAKTAEGARARAMELKAQGLSKEQAREKLIEEGYPAD